MALSPTSSHGGGVTSPLTTPAPLVLSPANKDSVALQFKPASGATVDATDLVELYDDAGHLNSYVDAASNFVIGLRGQGQLAVVDLTNSTTPIAVAVGGGAALNGFSTPTAIAFVSGTARQVSTSRDTHLVVPFTGDATNNAATLLIELSQDNLTFTTLDTVSIAAALNLTGAINMPISLHIPGGWYLKLTATHGTIGGGTYY